MSLPILHQMIFPASNNMKFNKKVVHLWQLFSMQLFLDYWVIHVKLISNDSNTKKDNMKIKQAFLTLTASILIAGVGVTSSQQVSAAK